MVKKIRDLLSILLYVLSASLLLQSTIKQILVKLMCSRKMAPKTPQSNIISNIRQQDVVLRCHLWWSSSEFFLKIWRRKKKGKAKWLKVAGNFLFNLLKKRKRKKPTTVSETLSFPWTSQSIQKLVKVFYVLHEAGSFVIWEEKQ